MRVLSWKDHIGRHPLLVREQPTAFPQGFPEAHIDIIGKRRLGLSTRGFLRLDPAAAQSSSSPLRKRTTLLLKLQRTEPIQIY